MNIPEADQMMGTNNERFKISPAESQELCVTDNLPATFQEKPTKLVLGKST